MKRCGSKNNIKQNTSNSNKIIEFKNILKNGNRLNKKNLCAYILCKNSLSYLTTPRYMGYDLCFCSEKCRSDTLYNYHGNVDYPLYNCYISYTSVE